jgi:dsRNA-specific ribonuclease
MAKKDMEIEMEAMPVDNVGIMQGFLEMMNEDDDEFEEDDEYEAGEMLGRTPDSPEILMNNLRGDMRSIDARRDELADMVGYAAAAETPESVLAMLQPVLAQQGIGAMMPPGPMPPGGISPVGAPNMPNMPNVPNVPNMPSEMMAPMQPMPAGGIGDMAPGAMPPGPPPLQMARGGEVQRFQEGSDEDGVTPADDTSMGGFPSDVRELARQNVMKLIAQQPTRTSDLATLAGKRSQAYRDILGSNQGDLAKLGFLTSLGERGFAYAANVDPTTGQPLRGSALSRFAGAARGLPAEMMKMAAATRKEEQAIKMAGIESAEKQIASEREANIKMIDTQRKAFSDILKASAGTDFGKGKEGAAYNFLVKLAPEYALGNTTDEQDRQFESAVKIITTPQYMQDPITQATITKKGELPDFASLAIEMRGGRAPTDTRADTGVGPGSSAAPAGATAARVSTAPKEPTLFEAAERGTGIIPVTASFIAKFPFMGNIAPGEQQATTFLSNSINQINRAISTNPRFAIAEQERIYKELDLSPALFDNPAAMRNRLIGLDDLMARLQKEATQRGQDESLKAQDRADARLKVDDIRKIRDLVGVPPRVTNVDEFRALPSGTPFLFYDPKEKAFVPRTKR